MNFVISVSDHIIWQNGGGNVLFGKNILVKKIFDQKLLFGGVSVVLSLSSALPPLLLFPGLHSSPH